MPKFGKRQAVEAVETAIKLVQQEAQVRISTPRHRQQHRLRHVPHHIGEQDSQRRKCPRILRNDHRWQSERARQIGSVQAVEGVNLEVHRGETLGLVGETGCGKSTLARCITRLHPLTSGRVVFDGVDISRLSARQMRPYRRRLQMIFQDPYGSLNPRRRVGSIIGDPLAIHGVAESSERKRRVQEDRKSVV